MEKFQKLFGVIGKSVLVIMSVFIIGFALGYSMIVGVWTASRQVYKMENVANAAQDESNKGSVEYIPVDTNQRYN